MRRDARTANPVQTTRFFGVKKGYARTGFTGADQVDHSGTMAFRGAVVEPTEVVIQSGRSGRISPVSSMTTGNPSRAGGILFARSSVLFMTRTLMQGFPSHSPIAVPTTPRRDSSWSVCSFCTSSMEFSGICSFTRSSPEAGFKCPAIAANAKSTNVVVVRGRKPVRSVAAARFVPEKLGEGNCRGRESVFLSPPAGTMIFR
jgi:hypothetical protein